MIRKNDTVTVMTGRDKGKMGKVLQVYPDLGRALVEKLNMVKKHKKPDQKTRQGGIVDKEAPIDLSNLMIYCGKCKKSVRTGAKFEKEGKKIRVCKKCGESIG